MDDIQTAESVANKRGGRPRFRAASVTLAMPPSANNAWINVAGEGRARSAEYCAWREGAGWAIRAARVEKVPGVVAIHIRAALPARSWDLDNIAEPLLDALTTFGVIEDERNVTRLVAEWSCSVEPETVAIDIRQVMGPQASARLSPLRRAAWARRRRAVRSERLAKCEQPAGRV